MGTLEVNLEKKLQSIFQTLLDLKKSTNFTRLDMSNAQAWDSLKHMEIIFSIEREFKIKLKQKDMIKMTSYIEILKILKKNI